VSCAQIVQTMRDSSEEMIVARFATLEQLAPFAFGHRTRRPDLCRVKNSRLPPGIQREKFRRLFASVRLCGYFFGSIITASSQDGLTLY